MYDYLGKVIAVYAGLYATSYALEIAVCNGKKIVRSTKKAGVKAYEKVTERKRNMEMYGTNDKEEIAKIDRIIERARKMA